VSTPPRSPAWDMKTPARTTTSWPSSSATRSSASDRAERVRARRLRRLALVAGGGGPAQVPLLFDQAPPAGPPRLLRCAARAKPALPSTDELAPCGRSGAQAKTDLAWEA